MKILNARCVCVFYFIFCLFDTQAIRRKVVVLNRTRIHNVLAVYEEAFASYGTLHTDESRSLLCVRGVKKCIWKKHTHMIWAMDTIVVSMCICVYTSCADKRGPSPRGWMSALGANQSNHWIYPFSAILGDLFRNFHFYIHSMPNYILV